MSVDVAAVYAPGLDAITIPSGTWSSFAAMAAGPALVADCATLPYDPNAIDRRAADDPATPYAWDGHASR